MMPAPTSSPKRIAVIGAGVIGGAVAWELSRRGLQVDLIDDATAVSRKAAPATSWTAGGILPPANCDTATDPIDQLRGHAHRLWPTWAEELRQQTGIDVGLRRCGGWYLAETRGEAAALMGMIDYWQNMQIECCSVSIDQLRQQLPELQHWIDQNQWIRKSPETAAWWVPDEYQIRPPRILQAFSKACQQNGVQLHANVRVHRVSETADQVLIHTDSDEFLADTVVLCGGAATGLIESDLGLEVSVVPIRGQILLLHESSFDRPEIWNLGNRYLIARGDGNVLVGSCEEEVGFNQTVTDSMLDELHCFAGELFQKLATAPRVDAWAGLRPMTFDGFPMIGKVPGTQRIFVNAGHYRSGIHLAPASAVLLADIMLGKPSLMSPEAFRVGKQQSLGHTS